MTEIKVVHVYDSKDELYSVPQAAEILQTSKQLIRKLIKMGELPCLYFGKNPKIRKFAINEFLIRNEGRDICEMTKEVAV